MLGLVVTPGTPDSAEVAEVPEPRPGPGEVLVRTLEVGVCGTDREIAEGLFGVPPEGANRLVLGHESLGVVERDGHGLSRGDLVTAIVRRSCGHCVACVDDDAPDACLTGDYSERGITRLDGYARELVAEAPEQLVMVPKALGRLGVLAEPGSICARAIRHARAVAGRQPWPGRRALVLGTGGIGTLATTFLRLDDLEVWTAGRSPASSPKAQAVTAAGATYVTADATGDLAADLGGFDLVIEATGDAQVMIDTLGLLRRNGVSCLLGVDGRERQVTLEGHVLGVDVILGNRALFGSVNANRVDWLDAVERLDRARERWPGLLESFVGLRVPPERFADAFGYGGVKATLVFDEA